MKLQLFILFIFLSSIQYTAARTLQKIDKVNCLDHAPRSVILQNTKENIEDIFSINKLAQEENKTIYFTSTDFHNELIFKTSDLPYVPDEYKDSEYLSIGFGSLTFWRTDDFYEKPVIQQLAIAKEVLLKPSKGVMSVSKVHNISHFGSQNQVTLSSAEYDKVLRYVKDSFEFDESGNWTVADEDLGLLKSNRNYSVAFTCNSWVSKALSQSSSFNFIVHPPTAKSLKRRLRKRLKKNEERELKKQKSKKRK